MQLKYHFSNRLLAAALLISAGLSGRVGAQQTPIAVPGEILVGMRGSAGQVSADAIHAFTAQGTVIGQQSQLNAVRLRLLPGVSLSAALATLRQRPDVAYAEPNLYRHSFGATPNDTYYTTQQYAPQKIHANDAWGIWQPQASVTIAIVDTGVDNTHPDLTNKILRDANGIVGYDAFTGQRGDARDGFGHGTHCAGIAAAQVNNGTGIAGIAGWTANPDLSDTTYTKIMPVRVLDNNGSGTDATVSAGIIWATDHGAKVISLSLGGPGQSQTLHNAVQYAWAHNCIIVAAAGNSASSIPSYPGADEHVVSVAATDSSDTLASFSNYGSWVSVAAPGVNIFATLPTYTLANGWPLNYGVLSGTSMAAPHVAGEAALILAQNPALTNAQAVAIIKANTDPVKPGAHTIGGGRINVYRALLAASPTGTPPAGLSAPTGLTAAPGNAAVTLAWHAVTGAATYNVKRRATTDGPYTTIKTGQTAPAYTDTGLTNGTTYTYVVSAANGAAESPNSTPAGAKPFAPPPATAPPAPPTGLKGIVLGKHIGLLWKLPSGTVTQIKVYRAEASGAATLLATLPSASNYMDTAVKSATTYTYTVTARNAGGESAKSNAVTIKTNK